MIKKIPFIVITISMMVLSVTACSSSEEGPDVQSQEDAQQQALEYLTNSPTFKFDGIQGSIEITDAVPLSISISWTFIYEFESAHAGYGNREGRILAQVITPHTAYITVQQGEITTAQLDNTWDILKQRELKGRDYPDGLEVSGESDIKGTITEISYVDNALMDGSLLVELKEWNATSDKFYIAVQTGTPLYNYNNNELKRITFGDFQIGQIVEVWFDGPVAESYPAQAKAKQILLR
ncbi:MAG: DUF3221 domain-containing protein [Dehalococcoidales bacterium]|nr:DUF3221 domain-containing protein [Dehalococcoidales bacterium]